MAQHDYDIANQSGANFRADLNNALDAIVSNNSGSSEPSTTFAYEWWIDTSANVLKLRNSANNAWITLPLSITADNSTSGALTVNGNLSTTGTLDVNGGEIILDSDADTSITSDTDDQIDFRIGGTDVATLTNSHLVLKGTTPKITIGDGGEEDTALIFDGNTQDFYVGLDDSADSLTLGRGTLVGANKGIIIDATGKVGINKTPTAALDFEIETDKRITFMGNIGEIGDVAGFQSINSAGSALAAFGMRADDLRFATGSSERIRIASNGALLVGTTTVPSLFDSGTTCVIDGLQSDSILGIRTPNSSATTITMIDFSDGANERMGRITCNASANTTSYASGSDINLKTNIREIENAIERVIKLNPVRFDWKSDNSTSEGFIAQNVEKDEYAKEWVQGQEGEKTLDYGKLTPLLAKAIQEQQDIIEDLKTRIEALEG